MPFSLEVMSMSDDFISDLIDAVRRVISPNDALLKEILIVSGMPQEGENLRYQGFNRQTDTQSDQRIEFSAVAVINNRRIDHWRLEGRRKKLSQLIFSTRWTRNPLDLFVNSLRCNRGMMDLMASVGSDFTLLGILKREGPEGAGFSRRNTRRLKPVIAIPNLDPADLQTVVRFETACEIRQVKIRGLPLFRLVGR
jgi:hypothetical protein